MPRAAVRDDDPFGIRAHEEVVRRSLPSRLGGGGSRKSYHVDDVKVDSFVVVCAPNEDEDHFAFWVDDGAGARVPLWLAKVLRVDDDNAKWYVSFLRGKGIGDEIKRLQRRTSGAPGDVPASQRTKKTTLSGAFEEVVFRRVTDGELSAEQGSPVVVFDGLRTNNTLKKHTVTEVLRVVRAAATLSTGHDGKCAACHEALEDDAVPECGCCARQFHTSCTGEADANNEATWWCSDCLAQTRE